MHPTYFKTSSVGYMVLTLNRKYGRATDKNFQSQSRDKINQHQENSIDEFLTEKETFVQWWRQNIYKTLVLKKLI